MTTYEKIKEVLDANMDVLTTKIDANRDISVLKFKELKEDIEELKVHVKETNGQVKKNSERVAIIEEQQHEESKRRKLYSAVSLSALGAVFSAAVAYIISKF